MPKLRNKLPSYCRHKASGQAVVTLNGRDHYLGEYGTPESRARYEQLIAEWVASKRRPAAELPAREPTGYGRTRSTSRERTWRLGPLLKAC